MGLDTVGALLEHLPARYEAYEGARPVAGLGHEEEATVRVRLLSISVRPTRRRRLRIVQARVADESGTLQAMWFNQDYLARALVPGDTLLLRGRVEAGPPRRMVVKAHEVVGREGEAPLTEGLHTQGLVPVYPATEAMPARRLRELVDVARPLARARPEILPAWIRGRLGLAEAGDALVGLHFPRRAAEHREGRRRLVVEELLVLQLGLAAVRRREERVRRAVVLAPTGERTGPLLDALPFTLTAEQRRVGREIARDLARSRPMRRLLQGEVGSGKTVVAALAIAQAAEAGAQAALLVPTETLAEQHLTTLDALLAPAGLAAGAPHRQGAARRAGAPAHGPAHRHRAGGRRHAGPALRGRRLRPPGAGRGGRAAPLRRGPAPGAGRGGRDRGRGRAPAVHDGHPDPADAGPHRLRRPARLDDPGPAARARAGGDALGARGGARGGLRARPRRAAPGPPGLRDLPPGGGRRGRRGPRRGGRGGAAAGRPFAAFRVGLAHGALRADEKRAAMAEFAAGRTDLLVATTVVEVGIDVPNATVMLVEGAERFGLAQLHQLRGRVGRGGHPGLCVLFGEPATEEGARRLEAVTQTGDGFRLAELDLEIRGEGTILGLRQAGATDLRFARLRRDRRELAQARALARRTLREDPRLERPEHRLLRDAVLARFDELPRLLDA